MTRVRWHGGAVVEVAAEADSFASFCDRVCNKFVPLFLVRMQSECNCRSKLAFHI